MQQLAFYKALRPSFALQPALQATRLGLMQAQAMDFSTKHRLKYETPREREERRKKYVRLM